MTNTDSTYRTPEDATLAREAEAVSTTVGFARDWLFGRETALLAGLPEGLGDLTFDRSLCGRGYRLRGVKAANADRVVAYIKSVRPGTNARAYPEVAEVAWDR